MKREQQSEYRSKRKEKWRASRVDVGQSRLDLTATTLCADQPILPKLGSVYRSQLARMRPRCNSWELESNEEKRMRQVTCLAHPK